MAQEDTSHLHIEFYSKTILNKAKSEKAGREVHDPVEMIRIKFVGDNKQTIDAPANQISHYGADGPPMPYKERFPEHYAAFKEGKEQLEAGTPLAVARFLSISQIADLNSLNVYTIEQIIAYKDVLRKKMGVSGNVIINSAEDYIKTTEGTANLQEMRDELETMKAELAEARAEKKAARKAKRNAKDDDEADEVPSPFEGWQDDDILNWIKDNGGKAPANATGKRLMKIADKLNAERKEAEEAA